VPHRRDSLVLFVHGAHHAGWCWLLVMDRLERLGIASVAIDLPFTGYADDVTAVRRAIAAARGRAGDVAVHVVGHSYAGLVVSEGGHAAAHLTLVAGRLPLPGESPSDATSAWGFPGFRACMHHGPDGVVRLAPGAGRFLFHRTSASLARLAEARLRPMLSVVPAEPVAGPAWTTVPSSYVVCADDRAVRPEAQRERAALVGVSVELDSDHSPFLSRPAELAGVIADQHRDLVSAA
jgi:Alpha/beta hydrolase family